MIESAQYIGLAIGVGMCLSLLLTETLGVTAGGVIVPGYIALFLHEPIQIIVTFSISLLVLFILRILSNFIFIYGKRRLVFSLLLGFFFGYLSKIYFDFEILNAFIDSWAPSSSAPEAVVSKINWLEEYGLTSIGNIIPGLIASWMDRQGAVRTISVIMIIAVLTRLIIILISGGLFHV